ncbi:endospore germination permease [Bacillus sp. MUM 116]|uniref:GerAB/ArcD/ProY family transporter n=1 Tax=Bacillus sp. MUM 116 TaxID=1678002 RepID=UPI000A7DBFDB|nr:endospore germination permease [Bacillus sp. MUM 116]
MIEKGKISAFQMGVMMYPSILATGIVTVPSITATYAKQDLWISPIWNCPIGLLMVFVVLQLHKLYPGENIIQYSERIMGRFVGKTLGIFYLFFFLHNSSLILREYAEFIITTALPKTPIIVVMTGMVLVCAFAVYGGVEVLARSALVFLPLFTLPLLLVGLMLLPDMEPRNILPIMGKGFLPSLKGAFFVITWFGDLLYLSFLLPFLTDREKVGKWGTISIMAIILTMVVTNLGTVFVLGGMTQQEVYPVMSIVRYISLAQFFEHVEAIVMGIWITGVFVKFSFFYYALVLGTAQWLDLSDYKSIVLPFGFLQVICSIWVTPNLQYMGHFFSTTGAFYFPLVEIMIPLFLLFAALIQKKYKEKSSKSSNVR